MRWLLLLALAGMGFSKLHFGSVIPPPITLRAPGFTVGKDNTSMKKPSWLVAPVHSEPTWLKHPVHRHYAWMKISDGAKTGLADQGASHSRGQPLDK